MSNASGVEPLEGESEADYVARQTRLREEAAARMRAKFGASGGLNGSVRMGGIGSSPSSGRESSSSTELLSSGLSALGSAASSAGWILGSAASSAAAAAAAAKEKLTSARETVRHPSYGASSNLDHSYRHPSSGSMDAAGIEGSSDISDLLGSLAVEADRSANSSYTPSVPAPAVAPPPSVTKQPPMDDGWGAGDWGVAQPCKQTPPAIGHHSSGGGGAVVRRKVAAVKTSSSGWDDDNW
mmetsp:Transcript_9083/g.19753  ORF Transcript_9083/g.19753 Transcript_9083/m.19753 type:complete len:240 (-) Transcript_9083:292-1011(-)